MAEVTVTPLTNGPYLIEGPVRLLDPDGKAFRLPEGKVALCRCGGSSNKPFCDGTHKRIEFKAETRAARFRNHSLDTGGRIMHLLPVLRCVVSSPE